MKHIQRKELIGVMKIRLIWIAIFIACVLNIDFDYINYIDFLYNSSSIGPWIPAIVFLYFLYSYSLAPLLDLITNNIKFREYEKLEFIGVGFKNCYLKFRYSDKGKIKTFTLNHLEGTQLYFYFNPYGTVKLYYTNLSKLLVAYQVGNAFYIVKGSKWYQ